MEFGYKADTDIFKEEDFGKWKFSKDEDIRAIVGDNADTGLKIAVMADVGRCNFKRDILPKNESPIDLIRIACYIHQIPAAIEMIEDAHKKGYETTCNIMAISTSGENDWRAALDMVCKSSVDAVYIVDSYGSLYPEQIQRICHLYKEYSDKYKKELGIHAHNNQQLAFANTIEACGDGVNILDATYGSMGRGAGNCAMELLLGFLKNPKYNVYPVLQFLEQLCHQHGILSTGDTDGNFIARLYQVIISNGMGEWIPDFFFIFGDDTALNALIWLKFSAHFVNSL